MNQINLTTSKIDRYKVFGDAPLPTLRIGVLADHDNVMCLDKPPVMYTFLSYFHRSGYPQLYDVIKHFWPDGCHAHRIDGTTSGCHMAGNGHDALSWITKGWKENTHKEYLAVVSSPPKWDYVEVTQKVIGNGKHKLPCTTGLTYLGDNLVRAELLDGGRTHQIRKAMQSVGFPISGDTLYGGEPGPTRPLLHAWRVTIDGWGTVQAPLAKDMIPESLNGLPVHTDGIIDKYANKYLWSFEVPPITPEIQREMEDFRKKSKSGVLQAWRDYVAAGKHIGRLFDYDGRELSAHGLQQLRQDLYNSASRI